MKKYIIGALLLFSATQLVWAQKSVDELTRCLQDRMAEIIGFETDARINVDIEFINIKERLVHMKYTAPDQFEFDAKGIALMPRNGMKMEYMNILNGANTAIPAGEEPVRGVSCQKIKVIPEDLESDIILAQLWMDPETCRIMRMQTFTRQSGSYLINFYFSTQEDILPIKLEVTFDIANLTAPAKMITEFMGNKEAQPDSLPQEAKVIVAYENMRVW